MYRIPKELDLSGVIGEFTTQICVGKFDIQFSLGKVHFSVWSPIKLVRNEEILCTWEEGRWPDSGFIELFNVNITKFEIPNDQQIILYFDNGVEMHLSDTSDQFESMQISIEGESGTWII